MRRLFLSDVHLSPACPERGARLFRLLAREASRADELYILGDLFDYWIGPRHFDLPDHREALDALRRMAACGTRVVLLKGNRDFYLGGFPERTGVEVAPGARRHEIACGTRRVFLCHGNYLDRRSRFARLAEEALRSQPLEWFCTRLPAWAGCSGAKFYRRISRTRLRRRGAGARAAERLSPAAMEACFREGFDVIVCGHFHRAARYAFEVAGQPKTLFTLGDWDHGPSYLVEQDGCWRLYG